MKILFVTSEFGSNGGGLSLSSERVFNYLSERYSVQPEESTGVSS